jgi:hypothetical protein
MTKAVEFRTSAPKAVVDVLPLLFFLASVSCLFPILIRFCWQTSINRGKEHGRMNSELLRITSDWWAAGTLTRYLSAGFEILFDANLGRAPAIAVGMTSCPTVRYFPRYSPVFEYLTIYFPRRRVTTLLRVAICIYNDHFIPLNYCYFLRDTYSKYCFINIGT